ncbi:MAG: hypothetical protein IT289_02365 [Oligoflexia bacterium]|nr:hypothetical protein [Oligoflexia bacterium]
MWGVGRKLWGTVFLCILFVTSAGSAEIFVADSAPSFEFKNCNQEDIWTRACAKSSRPGGYWQDSTGRGLSAGQITAYLKHAKLNGANLKEAARDGYSRFLSSNIDALVLLKFIQQSMDPQFADGWDQTLKSYVLLQPSEYAKMLKAESKPLDQLIEEQVFWRWLPHHHCKNQNHSHGDIIPNAFYEPTTQTIVPTPALVSASGFSSYSLLYVVAHEIGHHLDPARGPSIQDGALILSHLLENGTSKPLPTMRSVNYNRETWQCLAHTLEPSVFFAEEYADWIAALVLNEKIKTISDPNEKTLFAVNATRFFCDELDNDNRGSRHSLPRFRIMRIFRQPELRSALGCSSTVTEFGKTVQACRP